MTRYLPFPLLSAAIVLMWLLLNRFSLGHLLLGSAVGYVAGRAMAALQPHRPRIRRWAPVARLFGVVMRDIAISNFDVARLLVTGAGRVRDPGFVEMRLKLRDPAALAILAIILTSMPGTAWVQYDRASGLLLLHVLDRSDGTDWPAVVGERYERLLREIFE